VVGAPFPCTLALFLNKRTDLLAFPPFNPPNIVIYAYDQIMSDVENWDDALCTKALQGYVIEYGFPPEVRHTSG